MKEGETTEESIPLYELLVKTTYQTQITDPSDKNSVNPIGFGSGFFVEYRNNVFFITADHVVHPDDYDKKTRTGKDFIVSIFNNITPEGNFLSTVVTPLGGFYYMDSIDIIKPDEAPELIDVSLCLINEKNFSYPFLTDEVQFDDVTVKSGEPKFKIPFDSFEEPKTEKMYFVFGKIRSKIKGIVLHSINTLKENLRFELKSGDYYLLKTPEVIDDYKDWAGLSGSPVIGDSGECIGVLCGVNEKSNSIWVMSKDKIKILMDVVISQEQLNDEDVKT